MMTKNARQFLISLIFIPLLAYNPISGLLKEQPKEIEPSFITDSPNKEEILGEVREYTEVEKVRLMIMEGALLNDLDVDLFLALGEIESGFSPTAQNASSSAAGVLQIIRGTWNEYCSHIDIFENGRYDAEKNIKCGTVLLKPENGGINHWLADPRTRLALQIKGFVE